MEMTHIVPDADITYKNGAVVRTAFVTNLGGDVVARTAPDLHNEIANAIKKILREQRRELPKYQYPDHMLTAAMLQKYSKYGVDFEVRQRDCVRISKLDAQAEHGKTIFGHGLLLTEAIAAEKAAAHVWRLSDRELEIVQGLG